MLWNNQLARRWLVPRCAEEVINRRHYRPLDVQHDRAEIMIYGLDQPRLFRMLCCVRGGRSRVLARRFSATVMRKKESDPRVLENENCYFRNRLMLSKSMIP